MHRKLVSIGLGIGLAVGTMGSAYAGEDVPMEKPQTRGELVKAARDFWSMTTSSWSIMGFESAGQARAVLGGDWWGETARTLGIATGATGQVTRDPCMVTARAGQESQAGAQTLPPGQCG